MNRGERREKSKKKWLSRAKKIYNTYRDSLNFSSITEFLNKDIYGKFIKNTPNPFKNKLKKSIYKKENRKERYYKKDIDEGIQEYDSLEDVTCSSCIHYENCQKSHINTCSDYFD